jgi:hypothetical protein
MKKAYFKKVKKGIEVFGLIFGHGVVIRVYEDSFYTFEVEYDNGSVVPYTPEGVPAWSNMDIQTVYYKEDINLFEFDITPIIDEILSPKKIIKLRVKNKLEVKCPSGIWGDYNNCPEEVTGQYLEEGKFFLFRKKKKKTK